MTILSTPTTHASGASTSQHVLDSHPLKEKRGRLLEKQNQITQIQQVKAQLQQLTISARQDSSSSRRGSSSSIHSSWSVASNASDASLASEMRGRELLIPLSGVAFVPATVQRNGRQSADGDREDNTEEEGHSPAVYVAVSDKRAAEEDGQLVRFDEPAAEVESGRFKEMSTDEAVAFLEAKEQTLEEEISLLRDEVVNEARATLMEHLSVQSGDNGGEAHTAVDGEGKALNEEGLPFVDPVEPIPEGDRAARYAPLQPIVRDSMTKEAKETWMESVLSRLEDEEKKEETPASRDSVPETAPKMEQSPIADRQPLHRRLSSAERPAPAKSVLKQTGPIPLPLPKFGSAGIRRGFLNLNPSSPAAEQASDPVEKFDFSGSSDTAMSQSVSSMGDSQVLDDGGTANSREERMSRSMELPARDSFTPQKKKKTVRIQSPSREKDGEEVDAAKVQQRRAKSIRGPGEEDMEEEAKSILELLGLDAIKGHPHAAGLYDALKDSERMKELASKAEAARLVALEKEAEKPKKPAVGQKVMERMNDKGMRMEGKAGPKPPNQVSAFKKGFLNNAKPARDEAAVPAAPRISQGVPALERAVQSDQAIEEERSKQGLKPAVPHARPTKAYAEKLEAKRRGDHTNGQLKEDEEPAKMSKVRFGDEKEIGVEGETKGVSRSIPYEPVDLVDGDQSRMEDDDGTLDSIGMEISEEALDEDTVEALGYFSDEDFDPDIGLSDEDILQSKPQFKADGSDIADAGLRDEYERIKARMSSKVQGRDEVESDEEEDHFREGRDLTLQGAGEDEKQRISRFKQDRVQRALSGQKAVSSELGAGLEGARNVGPRMLIPSIANVRYPEPGQEAVEGQELKLVGQDDEEDDDLEELMRMRLAQRKEAGSLGQHRQVASRPSAPPQVVGSRASVPGVQGVEEVQETAAAAATTTAHTAKKPSLFKTRMSQK